MVRLHMKNIFLVLAIVDVCLTLVANITNMQEMNNNLEEDLRRNTRTKKRGRSTSSSSGERASTGQSGDSGESLEISDSSSTSSESKAKKNKYQPKSTEDVKGWRKWHRVCPACPADMVKKWRDPSIAWICGGYQRARRSFKSLCMMHYRNCQDGTMFVKLYDHRCKNDTSQIEPHGAHFFYDYKVLIPGESSKTESSQESWSASDD